MIHLDTHVVVWLYMAALERFPASLRERLDADELVISPMVLLELGYLYDVGRVMQSAEVVRGELERIAKAGNLSRDTYEQVTRSLEG